jgi:hypothetical protein
LNNKQLQTAGSESSVFFSSNRKTEYHQLLFVEQKVFGEWLDPELRERDLRIELGGLKLFGG